MTAAPLIVTAQLHIDTGECTRYGRWIRPPSAAFDCWRCFHHDEAHGVESVIAFVATVREAHRAICPSAANQAARQKATA